MQAVRIVDPAARVLKSHRQRKVVVVINVLTVLVSKSIHSGINIAASVMPVAVTVVSVEPVQGCQIDKHALAMNASIVALNTMLLVMMPV